MKKINITPKVLLMVAVLIIGFSACNKNNLTDNAEMSAAENFNVAEIEDDNIQIMADQAEATGDVSVLRGSQPVDNSAVDLITGCAIVTRDTISVPKKITIDFGVGCTNSNRVSRKGKIIVTYTGRYRDEGTVIHIVSDNYYVNANKLDIDRTVTNLGTNSNDNLEFAIHATRTVTFPGGAISSSVLDRTREWIAGAATPRDFADDIYRVNGTGTHTSRRGIIYDVTSITPLIRKVACQQFVSGEVKIVRNGDRTRFGDINFGNGECDDEATVTLDNGRTFNIDLRH